MMQYDEKAESLKAMLSVDELDRIKRLAITAMFSDDELMDVLVLKGGNALDVVYRIGQRASSDLDFSIGKALTREEIAGFRERVENLLRESFNPEGYQIIDVKFTERPKLDVWKPELEFWGGYSIEFKVIPDYEYLKWSDSRKAQRDRSLVLGKGSKKAFRIEISKNEYCGSKVEKDLDGYTVYVYSLEMIVCEKLRAICQQMPEYGLVVERARPASARARDFFDIYSVLEMFHIDLTTPENANTLRHVFEAKRVPLELLGVIKNYREFHRTGFPSLKDTVRSGVRLKDFDYYFDYVVGICGRLESLWKV